MNENIYQVRDYIRKNFVSKKKLRDMLIDLENDMNSLEHLEVCYFGETKGKIDLIKDLLEGGN